MILCPFSFHFLRNFVYLSRTDFNIWQICQKFTSRNLHVLLQVYAIKLNKNNLKMSKLTKSKAILRKNSVLSSVYKRCEKCCRQEKPYFLFNRTSNGLCCIIGQIDTSGKIELIPGFVLSLTPPGVMSLPNSGMTIHTLILTVDRFSCN